MFFYYGQSTNHIKPVMHCVMCGKLLNYEDECEADFCVCENCQNII